MAAGGAIAVSPLAATSVGAAPNGGPYGFLQPADQNGLRLPRGFTSRVVARTGEQVRNTGFTWHAAPDGGATFPTSDGGWIYVSNAEIGFAAGGASMIRFNRNGAITDARTILSDTFRNCSGGATPWGTWLSCEEISGNGRVWECDPFGVQPAVVHEALGRFGHEAAVVDPATSIVYMTEDQFDGGLYRFIPNTPEDLTAGQLQVMTESANGAIGWANIADPRGRNVETRFQVPSMKVFSRGEGAFFTRGTLTFATTGDDRVWSYNPSNNGLTVIYDESTSNEPVLSGSDNLTVDSIGDVFVCEDGGNLEIVVIPVEGGANPFMRLEGQTGTEITGVAFNPSGDRMYFSSQRNPGTTYEISGPFRGSGATPNPNPDPGAFSCSLAGTTLSWTNPGASEFFIREVNNGVDQYVGETGGQSFTVSGDADEYIVRYYLRGAPIDTRCAGNRTPNPNPEAFSCSLAGTSLSWTDQGASEYFIRSVNNGNETFLGRSTGRSFNVSGNDQEYLVRHWVSGAPIDARCPGNGNGDTPTQDPSPRNFGCSRFNGVLTWTDQAAPEYFIRAENNGQTRFLGSTSGLSFNITGQDDAYIVRYWLRGIPIDTRC